jgi:phospholipid transport system substrate-binding protein
MFARRRVLGRLAIILFGIAVLAASPGRGQAAATEDASAFLASLTDRVFAQLSDESLSMPERRQRFRVLFREHFDVPAIGRFVLGRYWRKAKTPVREDFLSVFEEIMVRRFAPKFANYAHSRFEIGLVRPLPPKGQYMVASTVVPTEGEPLHIDWRVRDKDGRLKILDVVGQGISMALTLRSEYASAIKDSGGRVEGLVDKLRARIESDPDTQTTSNTEN